MLKNFFIILIVLFLCTTTVVLVTKPKSHKPVVFENQNFNINLISNKTTSLNVDPEVTLPEVKVEIEANVEMPQVKIDLKNQNSNKTSQKITKNTNSVSKVVQKNEVKKSDVIQKSVSEKPKMATKQNTPIKKEVVPKYETNKVVKEPVLPEQKKIVKKQEPKTTLTEEQLEIIAWNKWRSDLQNQLMKDSKIAAPIGTTFYYTFTVDKNGNISNVKTWANNPSYTQMAVSRIKPVLLGYQKTQIVVFPAKSKRIITNVEGNFTMSYSNRYSTPADYHDYERVVH